MKIYRIIATNEPVTQEDYGYSLRMRAYVLTINEYQAELAFHLDYSPKRWKVETVTKVTRNIFGTSSWERED